jgi:hypothetical protein
MVDVQYERSNFQLARTNLNSVQLTKSSFAKKFGRHLPVPGLQPRLALDPAPLSVATNFSQFYISRC